jgi:hypothetical protein
MTHSKKDHLQRLLDYHFHQDTPEDRRQTERLLTADVQLQKLNRSLENMLSPLDEWPNQAPPHDLAERTLVLIQHQRQAETVAQHTMAFANGESGSSESRANCGRGRWVLANLREIITVAACLAIIVTTYRPGLRYVRQQEQQLQCAAGLRQIGVAVAEYLNDHRGALPYVSQPAGATWWNVGKQDPGQYSNTRNLFLLVKSDYAAPQLFVCPGVKAQGQAGSPLSPDEVQKLADFISRNHINYSFRLVGPNQKLEFSPIQPLLTDQSPLFSNFNSDLQKELNLESNKELWQTNSPNHQQRGQNILYSDGHVRFTLTRTPGANQDDIFTIQSVTRYRGAEQPQPGDVFIAP